MSGNILYTEDLAIGFHPGKGKTLISGLNLSCRKGEITGLIGKNGIGKSTLLKTMAGLLRPVYGNIYLNNRKISDYSRSEMAKHVSFVSTEIPHVYHLSVIELVSYGRFPYTQWLGTLTSDDREMVMRSIEQVGIAHIANKPVDEISDGERQRAMIARALSQNTPVIILDEPTAFLDLPNRYSIMRLLNELSYNEKKTILFSTHDLDIATREVDKIWLMVEDTMITGSPEDLIINESLNRLFDKTRLEFIIKSGEIKLNRTVSKEINFEGDGLAEFWTKRALERIGYKTVDNKTKKKLSFFEKDKEKIWKLTDDNSLVEFRSIYDLIMYLKE